MRKNPIQSKSINHSVIPGGDFGPSLKGTVTRTKKKTLHQVYNQVMMCEELGFQFSRWISTILWER